jgi:FkbM family methyltransferase
MNLNFMRLARDGTTPLPAIQAGNALLLTRPLSAEIRHRLRRLSWRAGLDIRRLEPTGPISSRRNTILTSLAVATVIDVGANAGQFGLEIREAGFTGQVISYEPLPDAYARLTATARLHEPWLCFNVALGDSNGRATINVAGNSESSSLLQMGSRHLEAAPESAYIDEIEVEVHRLDDVLPPIARDGLYLKLDVQGFEQRVLRGAPATLARAGAVEVEMSLTELYEGQPLMNDIVAILAEAGFRLVSIEPGLIDPATGHTLQADGIFIRAAGSNAGRSEP